MSNRQRRKKSKIPPSPDSGVASAVRDAVDSVLIPALCELRADIQATNNSVKELREELEVIATAAKQTRDRVDSV